MVYDYRDNSNLNKARENNNDEYYTQLSDIEKEFCHYSNKFENKVVYCNCDNPKTSKFWEYFHTHFSELKLRKLISTFYSDNSYKAEYSGGEDNNILFFDTTLLKENGSFNSDECVKTLEESDIVVTNPAFQSIYKIHQYADKL